MNTTTPIAAAVEQPRHYRLLAPWWHTLIVVGILLFLSLSQAHRLSGTVQHRGRLSLYITTMLVQWTMVVIIWLGIHWRGLRLRDLVGGKWKSPEDVLLDVGIAAGFWIVSLGVLAGVRLALGQLSFNSAKNMEQAKEFFRALIPLNIRWVSQSSINAAHDAEFLDLLSRSGCVGVLIGSRPIARTPSCWPGCCSRGP